MDKDLLAIGSQVLQKIALDENLKEYILSQPKIFQRIKKAAHRYIAGETTEEAISVINEINNKGFDVTTDFMGESTRDTKEVEIVVLEFLNLIKTMNQSSVESSISLDLSHIGLSISRNLAEENLYRISEAANKYLNTEVIISMEGYERTDDILNTYESVVKKCNNIGITIQAYLHRTTEDMRRVLSLPGSIRLVKGAYLVDKKHSIPRGHKLDEKYLEFSEQLISLGHKCSIASHDEKIHKEVQRMIDSHKTKNYVFERLLGIRNTELDEYKNKGYNCRIYVVYGKEWYLYLCNRWAEYPLNLFRGLADIIEAQ